MKLPNSFIVIAMPVMLAACSSGEDDPVPQDTPTVAESLAPAPLPPSPPPVPTPTEPQASASASGKPGCRTVSLGGHSEGEGLAKRWVPGPTVEICDPPQPIAAPVATIPPPPPPSIVATPGN